MRTAVSAALVVVALAPAACGGGVPEAGSHAELVAKLDARCKETNAKTKELNEEAERAAERAVSQEQLLSRLAPILERAVDQVRENAAAFRSIDPPQRDAAEIVRIRKYYDRQARLAQRLSDAAKRGEIDEFKSVSELQKDLVRRARKATSDFGFEVCGSTSSDAA